MNILKPLSDWNRRRLTKRRAAKKKTYAEWIRHYDRFDLKDVPGNELRRATQGDGPRISIVLAVEPGNADRALLSIESIQAQLYTSWDLCVACPLTTDALIGPRLRELAKADSRIQCITTKDSDQGLIQLALPLCKGEHIAVIGNCGTLPAHALLVIGKALRDDPGIAFLYVDEDEIDANGHRANPKFKPDWNEYLLRSGNYIGQFFVFKNSMSHLRDMQSHGTDAECLELTWRCTEQLNAPEIAHLPFVLYHAPAGRKAGPSTSQQLVLQNHYDRAKVAATVEITADRRLRTRYLLPAPLPLVSIIIPSKDRPALLRQCVSSVLEKTRYPNFEMVFIDNGTTNPQALAIIDRLCADPRFKVIKDASPFNYSRLNNAAVRHSNGEYICLMNNDIELMDPDWLHEMVSVARQPDVGAVGARLLYPDTSLQHVGVIVGLGGVAGHAFKGQPSSDACYMDRAALVQEYSAVTAACLLTPRTVYDRVHGLNEDQLTIAFNDIDYCLKVRELGKKVIYTPYAEFIHHESASRGQEDTREKKARFAGECRYMKAQWGHWLAWDPAYNPNLTNSFEDLSFATPPRHTYRHFLRSTFSTSTPGKAATTP